MSDSALMFLAAGLPALITILGFFYLVGIMPFEHDRNASFLREIEARMAYYAHLKSTDSGEAKSTGKVESANVVAHEVLLGMLKKVEGKNSSLATILTFLCGGLISFLISSDTDPIAKATIATFFPATFMLLVAALFGMRHVDDRHLLTLVRKNGTKAAPENSGLVLAKMMQDDLKYDLYMKERAFNFAWRGTIIAVIIFAVLLVLYVFFVDKDVSRIFLGTSPVLTDSNGGST